jgi:hypothetical protein
LKRQAAGQPVTPAADSIGIRKLLWVSGKPGPRYFGRSTGRKRGPQPPVEKERVVLRNLRGPVAGPLYSICGSRRR